jgi:hypothetical protein
MDRSRRSGEHLRYFVAVAEELHALHDYTADMKRKIAPESYE